MNNGQPNNSFTKQDQEFISCFVREMPIQDILSMAVKEMTLVSTEMSPEAKQELIEKAPSKLREILRQVFVSQKIVPDNSILRLLTTTDKLVIKALDSQRFLAKAKNTFKSGINSDFKKWGLDQTSHPTDETATNVYEMVANATFAQIFGSLSDDLNKLCLTQDQIEEFCLNHRNYLRDDGYATFFLFKENNNFFVAHVHVRSGGLLVNVHGLEYDLVWYGEYLHRIVIPA